jgi:DNA recombination protein RmuC
MDPVALVLGTLLAVAVAALVFLAARLRAAPERLEAERVAWEGAREELRRDLEAERARAAAAQEAATAAHGDRRDAEARLAKAEEIIATLTAERDRAVAARETAERERAAALQSEAVGAAALQAIEAQLRDFEKVKAEFLDLTRSATVATAQQISSKLLEDHKREAEDARRQREAHLELATKGLVEQFETIRGSVAELKGQVVEKGEKLETMWRALTTPAGAGSLTEVALANLLKSFKLTEGRDFVLQLTTQDAETGRRLRPDAVVFLPQDCVLVVDCKGSKFLHEVASAEGTPAEDDAFRHLARSMAAHLKSLADKDYRAAVAAECKRSGRGEPARIKTLMFLPNDAALERLLRADADFIAKAAQQEITPAGPAVLSCAFAFATSEIAFARRIENQERIVEATRTLMDALSEVLKHVATLGKGIKTAADGYAALVGSANARLLPRTRRLEQFGLRGNKALPPSLPAYQVGVIEPLIEGEAEEVVEDRPLPRLVRSEQ